MRFSAVFVLLALLLASCGRRDKTSHEIVGTWQSGSQFSMTLSAGGDFLSSFLDTNQTVVLTYQGTWQVRESVLMMTITNVSGTLKHETNGSIDRMRIVRVDAGQLALSSQLAYIEGGQTNYHPVTNYFDRR